MGKIRLPGTKSITTPIRMTNEVFTALGFFIKAKKDEGYSISRASYIGHLIKKDMEEKGFLEKEGGLPK